MTGPALRGPEAAPPRDTPGGGAGFGLRRTWPFLALVLGLVGVGLSFWRPIPAGVWHDDGVYMLIGKSLSEGGGLRYVGVPGELPAVKFPPLYPGVLGLLWLVFGAVGPVTLAATLLNLLFLAGAGGLMAWALHEGAGLRRREAVVIVGVAFASADLWRLALIPLSEPLFMLLAAGAVATWPRVSRGEGGRALAALAGLLAAAVMVRSAGMALVVGFGVALAARRGFRDAVLTLAPAVAAAVGWGWWASQQAYRIPTGVADVLGPYGGWLVGQLVNAPGTFLAQLPGHGNAVVGRILALMVPGLLGWSIWIAAVPLGVAEDRRRVAQAPAPRHRAGGLATHLRRHGV